MYETFYGFTTPPFLLPPDERFFFGSEGHNRAIAHLGFGLEQGEGFVVVTGEVGAGKTTLGEHMWSRLDHQTYAITRIVTTQLSGDDLFRLAMAGFGVDISGDKAAIILRFMEVLRNYHAIGRRCVLIVDEAQNLTKSALEELRMLSNFGGSGMASVQTILLGQPEFRRMLASQDLDQLRQRVIASFHLSPLGASECQTYILHRLTTAGWSGHPAIEPQAFDAVFKATSGVPRRINRLFSRVLLLGSLEEAPTITATMVEQTAEELARDLDGPARPAEIATLRGVRDAQGDSGGGSAGESGAERLATRVRALEQSAARNAHVMNQILDLLETRR